MFSKICFSLSLLGLVTGVLFSQVDLAEVQRKEKERRKKMPKSSVKLTDETVKDLKVQKGKYGYTQLQEGEEDQKDGNETTAAQGQVENDSAVSPAKDQAYWLSEKRRLDELIAEVSKDLAGLQLKIDALFTDYVSESRPFEKDAMAQELEELKATQTEKKEELTRLEQELQEFYTRARKEGVPPGWLRE